MSCVVSNEWDIKRKDFCDDCPHNRVRDKFKEDTETTLALRLKDDAKHYKFEHLAQTVRTLAALEGGESNVSVKTSWLLSTYRGEKRKYERFRDANRPKS